MKAAVCYEMGKPLVVEDVILDPPKTGEVKVRISATAICHTDIHFIRGDWGGETPFIVGHEAAGVIIETGENVTKLTPGDRVVISLLRSCGRCHYCTIGSPHKCEGEFALSTESRIHTLNGIDIKNRANVASFAEEAVVDQSQLVKIPESMPLDRAALLSCGVITGVGAVINTAKVEAGSSVAIIGVGGVGLNAIQGAVIASAHPVIAIDLNDAKLESAKAFGATHTINGADPKSVADMTKELTEGRGADYVFVTVGSSKAITLGLDLMATRMGTLILVGIPAAGSEVSIPISQHVVQERRIIGSFMGSSRLRVDVPRLIQQYKNGSLKLDELITKRYPLDQINDAIESTEKGNALRNVISISSD